MLTNQINNKFKIKNNIEFVFNGKIIEDNNSLTELEIKDQWLITYDTTIKIWFKLIIIILINLNI